MRRYACEQTQQLCFGFTSSRESQKDHFQEQNPYQGEGSCLCGLWLQVDRRLRDWQEFAIFRFVKTWILSEYSKARDRETKTRLLWLHSCKMEILVIQVQWFKDFSRMSLETSLTVRTLSFLHHLIWTF